MKAVYSRWCESALPDGGIAAAVCAGLRGLLPIGIALLVFLTRVADAVDMITTRSGAAGNPTGLWSDGNIWSAGQPPANGGGITWHVIVPTGVPITQVDGDYTINRLDLSGSIIESLDAGHLLTVVNELNVNGGIFRGPGTTLTQGQTVWASNAQINNNHVVQNSGAFSVADFLTVGTGGLFENLAGGAVTLQSDSGARAMGGANRNAGTYNLSVTSPFGLVGVSDMETTASGVVNVLSGPVSLTNPRQQAGTFNIANIASVSFANNNPAVTSVFTPSSSIQAAAGSGVTLSGLSRIRIEGAFNAAGSVTASAQEVEWTSIPANIGPTFTAGGGIARFSSGMPAMNNLSVASGTLTGVGDHQITGALTGSGTGVLGGNGTSTLTNGGAASGNLTIDQRKLVIGAGATATLSATLINNGELQNLGVVTDADFLRTSSSTGTFRNDALYNVTSNLHRVDAIFAGSGTTTIANGATLAIERDASSAQRFTINGSLNFGTTNPFAPVGTRTFDGGSSFTGAGSVNFARGTTTIAGNFAPGGPVTVEGGTANFNNAVQTISVLGTRFFSGGTFNFNSGLAQIGTLQLGDLGVLNISGNTTITGAADFVRSTHGGSGITTVQGMARLSGTFNGRQVDLHNVVVPVSGSVSLTNNATVRVGPAGRYNLDGFNVTVSGSGATPGQLVNAGLIDNTHASFPNDTFLFRIDVPFVQEATGRLENGHDLQLSSNVNAAGQILLTRPESQLLLQTANPGVVQTFTGSVSGPGSIIIDGPAVPPANMLKVNFEGGLDLSADTSELNIKEANVTVNLSGSRRVRLDDLSLLDALVAFARAGPLDDVLAQRTTIDGDVTISSDLPEGRLTLQCTEGLSIGANGLPAHLTLEKCDFDISGPVDQRGEFNVTLDECEYTVRNRWAITEDCTFAAAPGSSGNSVSMEGDQAICEIFKGMAATFITLSVKDRATFKNAGVLNAESVVVSSEGKYTSGSSPGTGVLNGNLTLIDTGTLSVELAGTLQGITYDFVDLNGTLVLNGGLLELTFLDGFQSQVQLSDVFTVLDADFPITGSFSNVPSGGQLLTSDGLGMFNVYYGAGSPYGSDLLVVTNFIPEPGVAALIVSASALLAGRRRRS